MKPTRPLSRPGAEWFNRAAAERKWRKLRRDPGLFFRDMVAKRVGPRPVGTGAAPPAAALRQTQLVQGRQQLVEAMLDAGSHLDALGYRMRAGVRSAPIDDPLLIGYHPAAFGNPYQQILYAAAPLEGAMAFPLVRLADLNQLRWPGQVVCHLHWLSGVLQKCATPEHGRDAISRFIEQVDSLRERGVRFVWTAHNVLPHEAQQPELECELRQSVIDRMDAIHIMTRRTFAATDVFYSLPATRTFLCEHPSYEGVYPDFVDRQTARYELELSPAARVFLFFGSIQEYKGLHELADAFEALGDRDDLYLVIAGIPTDKRLARELAERFAANERVRLHLRRIPVEEVQYFFRAADYALCPYKSLLNSGVAALAHSFEVPVVAPYAGALADSIDLGGGIGYDGGSPGALERALTQALETDPATYAPAISQWCARSRPQSVSRRFMSALREKLA